MSCGFTRIVYLSSGPTVGNHSPTAPSLWPLAVTGLPLGLRAQSSPVLTMRDNHTHTHWDILGGTKGTSTFSPETQHIEQLQLSIMKNWLATDTNSINRDSQEKLSCGCCEGAGRKFKANIKQRKEMLKTVTAVHLSENVCGRSSSAYSVQVCVCVVRQRGASAGYHFAWCKLVMTFPLAPARLSWGKQEESSEMRSGLVWASLASVSHHSELDKRCRRSPHLFLPPSLLLSLHLSISDTEYAGSPSPSPHDKWYADVH